MWRLLTMDWLGADATDCQLWVVAVLFSATPVMLVYSYILHRRMMRVWRLPSGDVPDVAGDGIMDTPNCVKLVHYDPVLRYYRLKLTNLCLKARIFLLKCRLAYLAFRDRLM